MDNYLLPSYQEKTPHGNKLSPYAHHHSILSDSSSQVLLHWHEEAEFGIIREGSAIYHIGSESYHVHAGDLLMIAPNTLHSVYLEEGRSMASDMLVFHLDLMGYSITDQYTVSYLQPFYNGMLKPVSHISRTTPGYAELYECMDLALNCVKERLPFHELLLKEKLNRLFYLFFQYNYMNEADITRSATLHLEKVKQALLFIQENYKEPLTVSRLAKLCNFSEIHFMNCFKKNVGLPCMEYIIQLRLKVSTDLLTTSTMSVSEIALECGFNNLSNFNRKFKAFYQQTPSEYRNQNRIMRRQLQP